MTDRPTRNLVPIVCRSCEKDRAGVSWSSWVEWHRADDLEVRAWLQFAREEDARDAE